MNNNRLFACGIGIGTLTQAGKWLEVFYPEPLFRPSDNIAKLLCQICNWDGTAELCCRLDAGQLRDLIAGIAEPQSPLKHIAPEKIVDGNWIAVALPGDQPLQNLPAAYLKLHLLSHRLCRPNTLNLDNLFEVLTNTAWTDQGAVALEELPTCQLQARLNGKPLKIFAIDKFPPLTDYVVPGGVRIADSARVRLGAYLGKGTTIMHEGFVNFNAGTEGPNMVEGRISAGVSIAAGSDLGGGSSTMGTLSGGNKTVISVGEDCLIGANAGTGIPLGDGCTIEAGLYITAGTVVTLVSEEGRTPKYCKARELAGQSNLLFRRNSLSGCVECIQRKNQVSLDPKLHDNE